MIVPNIKVEGYRATYWISRPGADYQLELTFDIVECRGERIVDGFELDQVWAWHCNDDEMNQYVHNRGSFGWRCFDRWLDANEDKINEFLQGEAVERMLV